MTDEEFAKWMWRDTFKMTLQAVGVYLVLIGGFWLTIG